MKYVGFKDYVREILKTAEYKRDPEVGCVVSIAPVLPGCMTQGDNFEEARIDIIIENTADEIIELTGGKPLFVKIMGECVMGEKALRMATLTLLGINEEEVKDLSKHRVVDVRAAMELADESGLSVTEILD